MADFVTPTGGPVMATFPIDPVTKEPTGTSSNPNKTSVINPQTRQANTTAWPANWLMPWDKDNNPAPVGVQSVGRASDNIATNQILVGTTAGGTLIAAARIGRNAVTITNLGTTDVYIGASGVTTGTGALLVGTKGASITIPTSAALYGIVGAGTQAVSFVDTF